MPLYRKALAINPDIPGLRLNLGLALFKSGELKEALAEFQKCLKAAPRFARRTASEYSHRHVALWPGAICRSRSLSLKRPPQTTRRIFALRLTLAHSCLWSKQYPCVLDAFHQIVALNAESAEAYMLMGETLDEMKDPVGAVREFRNAVKANPKEPNVHFGLGYLLWTKGQYPEAAAEFQAELDNDPHHQQAMLYLADAKMQMNQADEAQPLLEKLVKLDPGNAMAHRDLGIVYADQGRKEDAVAELEAAIKIAPKDVNAHYRLARLYRSMGRSAEAKAEFDKASTLNKAADEELYKKIAGGHARPPGESAAPGDTAAPAEPAPPLPTAVELQSVWMDVRMNGAPRRWLADSASAFSGNRYAALRIAPVPATFPPTTPPS